MFSIYAHLNIDKEFEDVEGHWILVGRLVVWCVGALVSGWVWLCERILQANEAMTKIQTHIDFKLFMLLASSDDESKINE